MNWSGLLGGRCICGQIQSNVCCRKKKLKYPIPYGLFGQHDARVCLSAGVFAPQPAPITPLSPAVLATESRERHAAFSFCISFFFGFFHFPLLLCLR